MYVLKEVESQQYLSLIFNPTFFFFHFLGMEYILPHSDHGIFLSGAGLLCALLFDGGLTVY
jgi:hypothetical protein